MSSKSYYYRENDIELTVNGSDFSVNVVNATAHGWSHPATRWEPEDGEFEIDDVDAVWRDVNGDVVEPDEAMDQALDAYLEEQDWEESDPPEPDYDDYEEAAIEKYEADCIRMGY